MKKQWMVLTALVMLIGLLFPFHLALGKEEMVYVPFSPEYPNQHKASAKKWVSTEEYRASLTILLYLSLGLEEHPEVEELKIDMLGESDIDAIGDVVYVLYKGDQGFLTVKYNPKKGEAGFHVQKTDRTGLLGAYKMSYLNTDNFYHNDPDVLLAVAEEILENNQD